MDTPISQSTKVVGFSSAVLATVFSLVYVVVQLAEWAGWLGSAGGLSTEKETDLFCLNQFSDIWGQNTDLSFIRSTI